MFIKKIFKKVILKKCKKVITKNVPCGKRSKKSAWKSQKKCQFGKVKKKFSLEKVQFGQRTKSSSGNNSKKVHKN